MKGKKVVFNTGKEKLCIFNSLKEPANEIASILPNIYKLTIKKKTF